MTTAKITKTLQKYQESSENSKKRKEYLRKFEVKMIYRTTKTENPQTTKRMVKTVLNKMG